MADEYIMNYHVYFQNAQFWEAKPTLKMYEALLAIGDKNQSNFRKIENMREHEVVNLIRSGNVELSRVAVEAQVGASISFTKFHLAALTGDLQTRMQAVSLVKRAFRHKGIAPLHLACLNPNPSVLKRMLAIAGNPSLTDDNRKSLAHYAALNENEEVMQVLVRAKGQLDLVDSTRTTPLHAALKAKNVRTAICKSSHCYFVFSADRRTQEKRREEE